MVVLLVAFVGCSSGRGESTRIRGEDILVATDQVRERLAGSDFLARRGPGDAEIRLAPGRLRNLSNDRLGKGDQLVAVRRVLGDQGLLELLKAKNVRVIMPPKEAEAYAAELARAPEAFRATLPTHALRAEFRSLSRAGTESASQPSNVRKDTFIVDYSILDMASSAIVWQDSFEITRVARGLLVD